MFIWLSGGCVSADQRYWDPSESTVARYQDGEDFSAFSLRVYGQEQPAQFQQTGQTGYKWVNDSYSTPRSYHRGNDAFGDFYNFYAASAESGTYSMTSGDATDSLCPKGWRIPSVTGSFSMTGLLDAYGIENNSYDTGDSKLLRQAITSIAFSGRYNSGSGTVIAIGDGYEQWESSLSTNSVVARYFDANTTHMTSSYAGKSEGKTVRCVKK